jgi:glucose/mannose-6-phosphate isomerase
VALLLVLLRDVDEHPAVIRRQDAVAALAEERGVPSVTLRSEGQHVLERLASLVGLVDFGSVYCALALGMDPTPIDAITQLKERIVR